MSFNESIVEDAALAMPMAALTPTLSQKERERRKAIRRLNPAMPEEALCNRQGILVSSKAIETRWKP